MEKIKVLSIMHLDQFDSCVKGAMPSHKMWGLYELSKREDINLKIISFNSSKIDILLNIIRFKPDIVYLPFFDSLNFIYAFLLKFLHILNFKVVSLCHFVIIPRSLKGKIFWKLFYHCIDKMVFFSPKSKDECVNHGFMKDSDCSIIHWGVDLNWINTHVKPKYNDYFVSTGKENRDFKTLITGFNNKDEKLIIFTKKENQGADYHYLENIDISNNIKIEFPTWDNSYLQSLILSANCKAYVIPLIQDKINYCVGWTSIVEAIALHKKIISTRNPYYPIDIEKESIGYYSDPNDPKSWSYIIDNQTLDYTQKDYLMFEKLSKTYNINVYSDEIYHIIKLLVK